MRIDHMGLLGSGRAGRRAFGLPSVLSRGARREYLARRNRNSRVSALNRHRNNQTRRRGSWHHNRCRTLLLRDGLHILGGLDFARMNRTERQARRRSRKLLYLRIVSTFREFKDIGIEFVDFGLRLFRNEYYCMTRVVHNNNTHILIWHTQDTHQYGTCYP